MTPIMWRMLTLLVFVVFAVSMTGCRVTNQQGSTHQPEMAKIKFPLDNINADGLRGPPGGLVAVAYEFCVPADEITHQEVQQIDPSLKIYVRSPGRMGCSGSQSLAIGETNQARWREVLRELSLLNYVDEIRECYFE